MEVVAFFSKKVAFGSSYPRYVIAKVYKVGSYCNRTRFIGMNWLGIIASSIGYVGIIVIA